MSRMPLASLALLLLLAPLLPGVATRTRALLTGRRGAPVHQLYSDLAKLWRKGVVYSTTTTWIFRLAPVGVTRDGDPRRVPPAARRPPARW